MDRQKVVKWLKTTLDDWRSKDVSLRAAAVAFFVILPLPSFLLIVLTSLSWMYGSSQATQLLLHQIGVLAGPDITSVFNQVLSSVKLPFSSITSTIVFLGFSLIGGIGAFAILRETMDLIWGVRPLKDMPFLKRVKQKIVPFVIVLLLGLTALIWAAAADKLFSTIEGPTVGLFEVYGLRTLQAFLSFTISVILFAFVYKLIPIARVTWSQVAYASLITAIAVTVTNYLFGALIRGLASASFVGQAGALMVLFLWILIVTEIVLFGAVLSEAYAATFGEQPRERLPQPLEKVARSVEEAGEKVEQAAKEQSVKKETENDNDDQNSGKE